METNLYDLTPEERTQARHPAAARDARRGDRRAGRLGAGAEGARRARVHALRGPEARRVGGLPSAGERVGAGAVSARCSSAKSRSDARRAHAPRPPEDGGRGADRRRLRPDGGARGRGDRPARGDRGAGAGRVARVARGPRRGAGRGWPRFTEARVSGGRAAIPESIDLVVPVSFSDNLVGGVGMVAGGGEPESDASEFLHLAAMAAATAFALEEARERDQVAQAGGVLSRLADGSGSTEEALRAARAPRGSTRPEGWWCWSRCDRAPARSRGADRVGGSRRAGRGRRRARLRARPGRRARRPTGRARDRGGACGAAAGLRPHRHVVPLRGGRRARPRRAGGRAGAGRAGRGLGRGAGAGGGRRLGRVPAAVQGARLPPRGGGELLRGHDRAARAARRALPRRPAPDPRGLPRATTAT